MSSGEIFLEAGSRRRLAAILAADIVGYSRLMGADEEGTLARVKRQRRELIEPTIAEHHGRLIKTTGDGYLVIFDSPLEAVRCAIVIQQSMVGRNAVLPRAQWLQFRIGVNLGDVIVDPDDIYGDGVNIAARLESLAEPGGVYISGGVYEQIKNKLVCGYQSLGDEKLKNITDPVRIYRVLPDPASVARAKPGKFAAVIAGALVVAAIAAVGGWYAPRIMDLALPRQPPAAPVEGPAPSPRAALPGPAVAPLAAPAPVPPPTPAPATAPLLPAIVPLPLPPVAAPAAPADPAPVAGSPPSGVQPPAVAPLAAPAPVPTLPLAPAAAPAAQPPVAVQVAETPRGTDIGLAPPPAVPPTTPPELVRGESAPPTGMPAQGAASAVARAPDASSAPGGCRHCPAMVDLPAGSVLMGSTEDPSEKPLRQVSVAPFALGRYPVTVGEWRECLAAGACRFAPSGDDAEPVREVSWNDAQDYVAWLSKVTGQAYRLPSEAEWEYAARAGTTTRYWWGNEVGVGRADCKGCGGRYDPSEPRAVGGFQPNSWGLSDMVGGVAQWVADCWHRDYQGAPRNASVWTMPNCREHVLRGGSWKNDPSYLRSASRDHYDSGVRYPTHGFRVARSL